MLAFRMKKVILAIALLFSLLSPAYSACDDPLADGVDYSKCRFSRGILKIKIKGSHVKLTQLTCLNSKTCTTLINGTLEIKGSNMDFEGAKNIILL